jgi:sugar phosphate isomerase/epimerase
MSFAFGPGATLGYCTNVHATATLEDMLSVLRSVARPLKARLAPDEPMGLGLWIPASVARELHDEDALHRCARDLEQWGLDIFTLNGFPYGDFHSAIVKHRVYEPDWSSPERAAYTAALIRILRQLPGGRERSISTLPLGWPRPPAPAIDFERAYAHLHAAAAMLDWAHEESGLDIHLDLEPEPGCVLQSPADAAQHMARLRTSAPSHLSADVLRRHIGICHDICHASVLFQEQADVLAAYRRAQIRIGKVQVSSAICAPFDEVAPSDRAELLRQLSEFAEPRYLHQTAIRFDNGRIVTYEDLAVALSDPANTAPRGEWRVHFHVPIHLNSIGLLRTTQPDILRCLRSIRPEDGIRLYEVETYAWEVLPPRIRAGALVDSIASEIQWLRTSVKA